MSRLHKLRATCCSNWDLMVLAMRAISGTGCDLDGIAEVV